MSELGNTTTPIEKPVEHAEKVDQVKKDESLAAKQEDAEQPPSSDKGKGKRKAVEELARNVIVETDDDDEDDEDDDDDDDDEDDDDSEDDDEDDLEMDEVDPSDIIPPSSRRSARSGRIDYSSEEALKKAGLAPTQGGEDEEVAASTAAEDADFKGDESIDD
ncbi:hypothetical protein CBS101457_005412 [Exobasidium rhododendri]|nr:hypothetical protein CBS101457_005412 [Exobasidium rhododendri]